MGEDSQGRGVAILQRLQYEEGQAQLRHSTYATILARLFGFESARFFRVEHRRWLRDNRGLGFPHPDVDYVQHWWSVVHCCPALEAYAVLEEDRDFAQSLLVVFPFNVIERRPDHLEGEQG